MFALSDIERLVTFDRAGVGHLSRALLHDQTRRCIEAQRSALSWYWSRRGLAVHGSQAKLP